MDSEITGIMVYYYFVCKRKLWYFCHGIQMEAENENVQLGKLLDASSYSRDSKHVLIDNMINIDFIRDKNEVHEVKKSKAIEDAGIWQLKYYLYYLKNKGVNDVTGSIDYPLLKKKIHVELSEEDIRNLEKVLKDIQFIRDINTNTHISTTIVFILLSTIKRIRLNMFASSKFTFVNFSSLLLKKRRRPFHIFFIFSLPTIIYNLKIS